MHLLRQNTLDIHCSSQDFGKEVQQQSGYLLEKEFYPKLELLLDKYEINGHTWNIDLLEISLPSISKTNWKNELVNHSLLQIEEYLKTNRPFIQLDSNNPITGTENLIANVQHVSKLFFEFLESGVLVENSISNRLEKIVEEIEITDDFLRKLIELFEDNSSVLVRWIFTVPNFFKEKVVQSFSGFPVQIRNIFEEIEKNSPVAPAEMQQLFKKVLNHSLLAAQWEELFQWEIFLHQKSRSKQTPLKSFVSLSATHWNISSQELKGFIDFIQGFAEKEKTPFPIALKAFLKELKTNVLVGSKTVDLKVVKQTDKKAINNLIENSHFITNAGLVLFHPFLRPLFAQLDLFENEEWSNHNSQHKAVLLSQYLITGHDEFYENELLLNKILCGMPVESVINTKLKISKKEKEKCLDLLESVIEYWKPMNGSSVEALRETFLQRPGKLDLSNPFSFELWVEVKGVDILLDQLPWGIGTIQTPWMEYYLTCNWN